MTLNLDLDQHWWHQAITWTNVDFSAKTFSGIHLREIWQKRAHILNTQQLPGDSELGSVVWSDMLRGLARTIQQQHEIHVSTMDCIVLSSDGDMLYHRSKVSSNAFAKR